MKTVNFKSTAPLNEEALSTLSTEVKETVATSIKTIFSVADLWNIQRRYKTSFYNRY
jgi:hypothetical protein